MGFGVSFGRPVRPIGIPSLQEVQDTAQAARDAADAAAAAAEVAAGEAATMAVPVPQGGDLLLGWLRLTTGSGHVAGADWRAVLG